MKPHSINFLLLLTSLLISLGAKGQITPTISGPTGVVEGFPIQISIDFTTSTGLPENVMGLESSDFTVTNATLSGIASDVGSATNENVIGFGIAESSSGNFYVTDFHQDMLRVFNSSFQQIDSLSFDQSAGVYDVNLDENDNIFVTDISRHRIYVFSENLTPLDTIGSSGTADGQFQYPTAIAFLNNGDILVTDNRNDRVQIFDPVDFSHKQNVPLNRPRDVTVDPLGNVIVTGDVISSTRSIYFYDPTLTHLGKKTVSTNWSNFVGGGVTVISDGAGLIYFLAGPNKEIRVYSIDAQLTMTLLETYKIDYPYSANKLLRTSTGKIYAITRSGLLDFFKMNRYSIDVTPVTNGDITISLPASSVTGLTLEATNTVSNTIAFNFDSPAPKFKLASVEGSFFSKDTLDIYINVDDDISGFDEGDISPTNASVVPGSLVSTKTILHTSGTFGSVNPGEFDMPWDIAQSPVNGDIYVADRNNNRVQIFTKDYEFKSLLEDEYNIVSGIFIDKRGTIFVADQKNNRVVIYDSSHQKVGQLGTGVQGNGNDQFYWPVDVFVDDQDRIHVADQNNDRIQIFDNLLNLVATIDELVGQPQGITMERKTGRYFVSSYGNYKVNIYEESEGQFTLIRQMNGTKPRKIASDSTGLVYVAIQEGEVIAYDNDGDVVSTINTIGSQQLAGLEVGLGGQLLVTEWEASFAAWHVMTSSRGYLAKVVPGVEGTVQIDIPANVAESRFLIGNEPASYSLMYDLTAPSATLESTQLTPAGDFRATITFTESVAQLDTSDFTVLNCRVTAINGSGNSFTVYLEPIANGLGSISLDAGSYTDLADNPGNASNSLSFNVSFIESQYTTQSTIQCYGETGSITLTTTGGNPFSTGDPDVYEYQVIGPNHDLTYRKNNVITNLEANEDYTINVRDAEGYEISIENIRLPGPDEIVFTVSMSKPTCLDEASGSITFSATGGAGGYEYSIDGGQTFQSSQDFTGLTADEYQLGVRDSKMCVSTIQSYELSSPQEPLSPQVMGASTVYGSSTQDGLVITPDDSDTVTTHFLIENILAGTLFYSDGVTQISSGNFITVADGATGLVFLPSGVGSNSFEIQAAASDNNACVGGNVVTAEVTVAKANLTVSANDTSRLYGEMNPSFSLSIQGFVNDEDENVLTALPALSTTATQASDAGMYAIEVGGGESANYQFEYVPGTLTIGKSELIATADDILISQEEVIPELTITYAGFVNGDDADALDTEPTASTTAVAGVPGIYAITLSGGSDNNYEFTYVGGELTIQEVLSISNPDGELIVYPNPVQTILSVQLENWKGKTIEISDLSGKQILAQPVTNRLTELDLDAIPEGVYLIKVYERTTDYYSVRRIIINR
jgi:streptogramin lyase